MAYTFFPEAEHIAAPLIDEFHPHLTHTAIAYMITEREPVEDPNKRRRGRPRKATTNKKVWLAKCTLVNQRYRMLFEKDYQFIITVNADYWSELTLEQQTAVIDHELCHAVYDDEGNPRLRKHDLEEFRAVVYRHGLYLQDVEAFADAINRRAHVSQQS